MVINPLSVTYAITQDCPPLTKSIWKTCSNNSLANRVEDYSLRFKAVFENFTLGEHRKIDCNKGWCFYHRRIFKRLPRNVLEIYFYTLRYVFKPAISGQTLRDFTWPRFHNECSMPINFAWVLLLGKFITSHICVYYYVNDRVCETSVLKTVKYDRRRVQENAFKCI